MIGVSVAAQVVVTVEDSVALEMVVAVDVTVAVEVVDASEVAVSVAVVFVVVRSGGSCPTVGNTCGRVISVPRKY